jgi:hypothetical protein
MDRGAVFGLAGHYVARFSSAEHAALSEYKFTFLRSICNHEHFIPLNLPLAPPPLSPSRMRKPGKKNITYLCKIFSNWGS